VDISVLFRVTRESLSVGGRTPHSVTRRRAAVARRASVSLAIVSGCRLFTTLLAIAIVPPAMAMLASRPAPWYVDSISYVGLANHPRADLVRTDGYPFLLWVIKPFHSAALLSTLQHLFGPPVALPIVALVAGWLLIRMATREWLRPC
jgi:hypothetical protein